MAVKASWHRNYVAVTLCIVTALSGLFVCLCVRVCPSVTTASLAETAEPIEVWFGVWTWWTRKATSRRHVIRDRLTNHSEAASL